MTTSVGILGLGVALPAPVRHNDWWPQDLVESWAAHRRASPRPLPSPRTPGQALVLAALREQAEDPFQGAVARRILEPERSVFDLEEEAARAALADAGVTPAEIDLVLTFTLVPPFWIGNPACALHARLGLPRSCLTLHIDAAAFSFLGQLALADAMIRAGSAKRALLVQSSIATRLSPAEDPQSVLVGDGASAVVVGPVASGFGIEASVAFTDGRFPKTLIASVPGKAWYDDGRATMHVADWVQMTDVFLSTADTCKESLDAVLERAGRAPRDIDFLCILQGTPWLRRVAQTYAGLAHAKSCDTFPEHGYLSGAMIPTNLCLARDRGVLVPGDLVALTGGGTGMTHGATLLRWGTA